MSLINKDEFATLTELGDEETFSSLFKANTHIKNHAEKDLVLPATTLKGGCYTSMFEGCTLPHWLDARHFTIGFIHTNSQGAAPLVRRCAWFAMLSSI